MKQTEIEMSLSEFAKVLAPVGKAYNTGSSIVKVLELSHFNNNDSPVYRLLVLHWNNKLIDGEVNCIGVKVYFDEFTTYGKFEVDPADFYKAFDEANKLFWQKFWERA